MINEEIMDIYDAQGRFTGQTAHRWTRLSSGLYFLCAHLILEDMHGGFLLQQRSEKKAVRPGVWDITAGAVDSGETSAQGIVREASEEIGLKLREEQLIFLFRNRTETAFHDVYYARMDFSLEDLTMQDGEVQALRLVSAQELIQFLYGFSHRNKSYVEHLSAFLEKRILHCPIEEV